MPKHGLNDNLSDWLQLKEMGSNQEIEDKLTKEIKESPCLEAYNNRGVFYWEYLKDFDKAIADYDRGIALDPENPKCAVLHTNYGIIYGDKGMIEEAIKAFSQAIILNPLYPKPYFNRGVCYKTQDKLNDAIADFTQVIALKPEYAEAYYRRALSYQAQEKYQEATADYCRAIELNPDYLFEGLCNFRKNVIFYAKEVEKFFDGIIMTIKNNNYHLTSDFIKNVILFKPPAEENKNNQDFTFHKHAL